MREPLVVRVPGVGGVELAVRWWEPGGVAAGATPFLLAHGLASNARLWDGVAAALVERGHPVAAVDLRGHGQSDKPDEGYDYETVAGDVVAVIEGLGFERPVVAGQSWGGNVVMELAAREPAAVRGIACVDGGWIAFGHLGSWEEVAERLGPPRLVGTPLAEIEDWFRTEHGDWPESGIQGALANFEIRADGTVAPWLTRERHMQILRAMWEERIEEVWPKVDVPVLLVPCDDGSAWAEHKREQVAAAERALRAWRTVWFRADHDVHAQRPDDLAELFAECAEEGFWA